MALLGSFASEKDLDKIGREIERDLKAAMKAANLLTELNTKIKPPKITARMGAVSKEIYSNEPVAQSNILNNLPHEVQREVWSYLVHQPDRIALALTCKENAMMHDEQKLLYQKVAIKTLTRYHRIPVMIRVAPWMGPHLRLCFMCVRFCPVYSHGGKDWAGDSKLVHEDQVKNGRLQSLAYLKGPRCPKCCYREGLSLLSNKSTVQEYKALVAKHNVPAGSS